MASVWNTTHNSGINGYDSTGRQITVGGHGNVLEATRLAIHATESSPFTRNNNPAGILKGGTAGASIGGQTTLADSSQTLLRINPGWQTHINNGSLILISG